MPFFQETPQGIVISIHVQPRSSRNRIMGLHGDSLKIAIQAPPVDDAANRMCIAFLSESLNLPRSRLEILTGHTGRYKRVLLRIPAGPAFSEQFRQHAMALLSLASSSGSETSSRHRKKTA